MQFVELIAILAVIQLLCFGVLTGNARRNSGLKAPAIAGNAEFERMYRVQMNTLENFVLFLPSLYLAGQYWPAWLVAVLGAIYLVGRTLYWRAYIEEPAKRGTGFMLAMAPTALLALLALLGILLSLLGLRG